MKPLRKSGQWKTTCASAVMCIQQDLLHCFYVPCTISQHGKYFSTSHLPNDWQALLFTRSTRCLFSISLLLKQTNKRELTCYHKLWVHLLVQILFSILIVRSTRDLFREGLVRKWPQQFKTLQLGFILTIDRGTLEEYYALWGAWTNLGGVKRRCMWSSVALDYLRWDVAVMVLEYQWEETLLCREPCGPGCL